MTSELVSEVVCGPVTEVDLAVRLSLISCSELVPVLFTYVFLADSLRNWFIVMCFVSQIVSDLVVYVLWTWFQSFVLDRFGHHVLDLFVLWCGIEFLNSSVVSLSLINCLSELTNYTVTELVSVVEFHLVSELSGNTRLCQVVQVLQEPLQQPIKASQSQCYLMLRLQKPARR